MPAFLQARGASSRWILASVIFGLAALALAGAAASDDASEGGTAQALTCGQTVTTSVSLTTDLLNCTGHGLVIGANGITINLAGHVISHTGEVNAVGISVGSFRSVTITNGSIRSFLYGITAGSDSRALRVQSVRVSASRGYGMIIGAAASRITANTVFSSALAGILAGGSSDGSRITNNTATGNGEYGIVAAGDNTLVTGNRAVSNGTSGIYANSPNGTISNNIANSNDQNGIRVPTTLGRPARVGDNKTYFNTELGILAVPGVTDLGDNRAGGNGDLHQCENVVCS
jgi:parallel beta-helix repeat protein